MKPSWRHFQLVLWIGCPYVFHLSDCLVLNANEQTFSPNASAEFECIIKPYTFSQTWYVDSISVADCGYSACSENASNPARYSFTPNTSAGNFIFKIDPISLEDNDNVIRCFDGRNFKNTSISVKVNDNGGGGGGGGGIPYWVWIIIACVAIIIIVIVCCCCKGPIIIYCNNRCHCVGVIQAPEKETSVDVIQAPEKETNVDVIQAPEKETSVDVIQAPEKETNVDVMQAPDKETSVDVIQAPEKETSDSGSSSDEEHTDSGSSSDEEHTDSGSSSDEEHTEVSTKMTRQILEWTLEPKYCCIIMQELLDIKELLCTIVIVVRIALQESDKQERELMQRRGEWIEKLQWIEGQEKEENEAIARSKMQVLVKDQTFSSFVMKELVQKEDVFHVIISNLQKNTDKYKKIQQGIEKAKQDHTKKMNGED